MKRNTLNLFFNTFKKSVNALFCVLSYYLSLRYEFCVVMSVMISTYKWCSVRLYLQLFVGRLVSSLRYLCLFAHSDVKLCCVFVLFLFVLCTLCSYFLWIFHFKLPLRCSLKCIVHAATELIVDKYATDTELQLLSTWHSEGICNKHYHC